MLKPKGGRGKTAPYETCQVRVPVPIKSDVETLIANYRNQVLEGESKTDTELTAILSAIKLVDRFIDESKQREKLNQRNNTNLVRFRNWLHSKTVL